MTPEAIDLVIKAQRSFRGKNVGRLRIVKPGTTYEETRKLRSTDGEVSITEMITVTDHRTIVIQTPDSRESTPVQTDGEQFPSQGFQIKSKFPGAVTTLHLRPGK